MYISEIENSIKIKSPKENDYEILLRDSFDQMIPEIGFLNLTKKKVCICADSHVASLYLKEVLNLFKGNCAAVVTFSFPAGEEQKQLKTVEQLYRQLIRNHFDRNDLLVALGGGVTGDLTGYCSATYLRGIDFLQIPTTLLSQVDSSIGGKTGVDFLQYKNMVGAFHQPVGVYVNTSTLKTLDDRTFSSGMGEVIKHGLIKDRAYFDWIYDNREAIKNRESAVLGQMITTSLMIKKQVVEADPYEKGERALLNFGHTIGHAVEKLLNFNFMHGECVGAGCMMAMDISRERGYISLEEQQKAQELFQYFGLDVDLRGLSSKEILDATKSDKKMDGDAIKFILLRRIGEGFIDRTVSDHEMEKSIEKWVN